MIFVDFIDARAVVLARLEAAIVEVRLAIGAGVTRRTLAMI